MYISGLNRYPCAAKLTPISCWMLSNGKWGRLSIRFENVTTRLESYKMAEMCRSIQSGHGMIKHLACTDLSGKLATQSR